MHGLLTSAMHGSRARHLTTMYRAISAWMRNSVSVLHGVRVGRVLYVMMLMYGPTPSAIG